MTDYQQLNRWKCPACGTALHLNDRVWRCEQNHSYDKAKEGYVNLLLAHQKNSKAPGDNKMMINARRSFLESGHYAPLANGIVDLLAEQHQAQLTEQQNYALFDAGCGEGYYLNVVQQKLRDQAANIIASGIDISKVAIQKAAKKYQTSQFAVASSYAIPLHDASQDTVIQVFAPSSEDEIARVLKPTGLWVLVSPAENHLAELKSLLYEQAEQHKPPLAVRDKLQLVASKRLSYAFEPTSASIKEALILMTPFAWQLKASDKPQVLEAMQRISADFYVQVWALAK